MKLKQFVLFIDILGYGNVTQKIKSDEEANDFINFMKSNEDILTKQSSDAVKKSYSKDTFNLYEYYDIEVAFISDSLVINYKPIEFDANKIPNKLAILHSANSFIIILMRLQAFIYSCLKSNNKLLLRGGISDKYCKITDNFAVGEGVIEAYKLESTIAKYPRIAISEDIINDLEFMQNESIISNGIYNIDSFITKDKDDNVHYLDYLKYHIGTSQHIGMNMLGTKFPQYLFFDTHKKVIEEKLNNIKLKIEQSNEGSQEEKSLKKIKMKYDWLKAYHNNSIKAFDEKLLIKG